MVCHDRAYYTRKHDKPVENGASNSETKKYWDVVWSFPDKKSGFLSKYDAILVVDKENGA